MTDQRKAQESIMIKTANKTVREGHTSFGRKKSKRFLIGFSIYMLLLFSLILVGLALLWRVMDAFERSRPNHRMEAYLAETDSDYWRNILLDKGVGRNFVGTLDLEDASFYKKMDMYTDAVPTYGIRFGKEEMLTVSLEKGEDLSYGYHLWEIGSVDLIGRELYIFAPPDAVISRDGKEIGKDIEMPDDMGIIIETHRSWSWGSSTGTEKILPDFPNINWIIHMTWKGSLWRTMPAMCWNCLICRVMRIILHPLWTIIKSRFRRGALSG